jgi:nucleoside-diphosphate-sugar epimerase
MKNIFITGDTGFVGRNILTQFSDQYTFTKYDRKNIDLTNIDIVLHLAGKAHDFDNSDNFEYYNSNTELTKKIFDSFLESNAKTFITLSSVKAVADSVDIELTEQDKPNPKTHYGKSKLLSEQYILSRKLISDKRFFILRPCMIHGLGNKGNMNTLFEFVKIGLPWPLGSFDNKRSFCSIGNLCFVLNELILNENIQSGIYNIADDDPISTNHIIKLISSVMNKNQKIFSISPKFIKLCARIGDFLYLPFNTIMLNKLTQNYIVSNKKIKNAIKKNLPIKSEDGLLMTFYSFYKNNYQ